MYLQIRNLLKESFLVDLSCDMIDDSRSRETFFITLRKGIL